MKDSRKIRITLGSFDLIKGIAMICIVVGHTMADYDREMLLNRLPILYILGIGTFAIPAFFMISGYGFREKTIVVMLKNTVSGMLKPYLFVMLAIVILYPYMFYLDSLDWNNAVRTSIGYTLAYMMGVSKYEPLIFGYQVKWIGAIWFLLASFVAFNVMNLIIKVKNTVIQTVLAAISFAVGYVLLINGINYGCLPHGLIGVGYSYIGYMLKKHKLLERLTDCPWVYIILIPISFAEMKWGYFDLNLGSFRYGIAECIVAGAVGLLLMIAGVKVGQLDWKVLDWIKGIGMYSYWIFCVHNVDMALPQWHSLANMGNKPLLSFALAIAIRAAEITIACVIIKRITEQNYIRRKLKNVG